jgi:hypothetical protein
VENVFAKIMFQETNVMFVNLNIMDSLLVNTAAVMLMDQLIRCVIIMENVLVRTMWMDKNVQHVLLDMIIFQIVTSVQ